MGKDSQINIGTLNKKEDFIVSGMEWMSEAMETIEGTEMNELLGQRETLQAQLEAAQEAGNVEKANFFNGEIAKLDEMLAQAEGMSDNQTKGQEISFGSSREGFSGGHSESYWKQKAGEEYVKNGESASYKLYIKRAGEAKANSFH